MCFFRLRRPVRRVPATPAAVPPTHWPTSGVRYFRVVFIVVCKAHHVAPLRHRRRRTDGARIAPNHSHCLSRPSALARSRGRRLRRGGERGRTSVGALLRPSVSVSC
mgnify:FL=1